MAFFCKSHLREQNEIVGSHLAKLVDGKAGRRIKEQDGDEKDYHRSS